MLSVGKGAQVAVVENHGTELLLEPLYIFDTVIVAIKCAAIPVIGLEDLLPDAQSLMIISKILQQTCLK